MYCNAICLTVVSVTSHKFWRSLPTRPPPPTTLYTHTSHKKNNTSDDSNLCGGIKCIDNRTCRENKSINMLENINHQLPCDFMMYSYATHFFECAHFHLPIYLIWKSRNSSVSIVTRLHCGQPRNSSSIPRRSKRYFLSPKHPAQLWGLSRLPFNGNWWVFRQG